VATRLCSSHRNGMLRGGNMTKEFTPQEVRGQRRETSVRGVVDSDDQALRALLHSPATWGEIFLSNRDDSPRRYRAYQREDLECDARRIVHMDGRSVGKTIDLSTMILWFAFTHPGKSVLVAAPYQGHLDTIIEEVEHQIETSAVLYDSVALKANGSQKIKRKPYFEVGFTNGAYVYFRPGGVGGYAFRSLHVDLLLVDEAAWLPEEAWKAIRPCLNPGGQFRVYSTPNGLRNTYYYRITHGKTWERFQWPSWLAPDWSPEREKDLLDFYGGKDTPGWQHEVAGKHGKPTYGAFHPVQVIAALDEIKHYRKVSITGDALKGCANESEIRARLQDVLQLKTRPGKHWVGGDLGYTSDPTELLMFEEDERAETLTLVLRIHAEQVPYPVISEIIALVDRVYSPLGIGVDRGGNGMSVVQELLGLDKFRDRYFTGRLVGYDFGSSIAVGEDERGRPIKKRTKEEMTSLINKAFANHGLVLPKQDPDVEDQLCTQTYVLTDRGVVYSKGNDHIVDAMRCALLRHAQERNGDYDPVEIIVNLRVVCTDPIF
jgi:hypothetical protein